MPWYLSRLFSSEMMCVIETQTHTHTHTTHHDHIIYQQGVTTTVERESATFHGTNVVILVSMLSLGTHSRACTYTHPRIRIGHNFQQPAFGSEGACNWTFGDSYRHNSFGYNHFLSKRSLKTCLFVAL